jgi:hypothetical protein
MSSDTIITEKRTIGPFSGIKFTGIGHVFLTQGETTSLEVKAPAAMLQKVKTEIEDDLLVIGFKFAVFRWLQSIGDIGKIEFHVSSPVIDTVISNGAGKITTTGTVKAKDMTIKSTGAGYTEISIEASTLLAKVTGAGSVVITGKTTAQDITITGAGKYESFNLASETAKVHSTGSGQAFINVTKKLDAAITGVGTVKYKGEPAIESRVTGLGRLESGN